MATQNPINNTLATTALTGTLQAAQEPAHTGDVTNSAGSLATTVAKIQGAVVSGTTGTTNVVFSASPVLTGTPALAASTATTSAQGNSSTNVATTAFFNQNYVGGYINKFRNGQMNIAQRGSAAISVLAAAYTLDGFIGQATTAAVTYSQQGAFTTSYGFNVNNFLQIVGATSNTDVILKQRIEGAIAGPLSNQQVTFQAQFNNGSGGTVTPTLTVKHAGSLDNWSSPVTDVNAVSLQAVANGATGVISYTFAASGNSYFGLEVTVDFGALNSNTLFLNTTCWDIRATPGVSTGLNSNPPYPELRPITSELPDNQRYYRKSFPQGTAPAQSGGVTGAVCVKNPIALGDPSVMIYFNPPMRAAPTITTYNPSASNANWRDTTSGTDVTVSVDPATAKGDSGFLIATSGTVTTLGDILAIHYTASSEL